MKKWKGQIALVTGASSGVGEAIARALHAEGVTVCVAGRRPAALKALQCGPVFPADLASEKQVLQLAARVKRQIGGLDILVHSAALHEMEKFETASLARLDEHYHVNLRAPFALTQALLPVLRARRGHVVFINSSVAHTGKANVSQYAATKSALKVFANSLRDEVNADGIRVLNVFLGRVATPMQAKIYAQEGRAYHPDVLLQPGDVASVVVHSLGLPRTAEVTEVHIRPAIKSY